MSVTRDNGTLRSLLTIAALAVCAWAASPQATLDLGRRALLNEGVATAWRLSQQALVEAPSSAAAHEFSGEVLFRRGDFAAAEAQFRTALKLDPSCALAWWGLARVSEISSLHKTSAQYYARAYELNPKEPAIFRDWAMRLSGREHIQALERYAAMADPNRQPSDLEDLRRHIALDRALNGRRLSLATSYHATDIALLAMNSEATHMRTYGVEVTINDQPLRLILDTGASGILIPRRAGDRAGLTRLAEATFGGFGDNKTASGYHALAARLRVGAVEFHDALINVSNQESVGDADGLIGTDVFSQFLITLDFSTRNLHLDLFAGYQPGQEELHDRVLPADPRTSVPVFRFGHLLLIPTRVNDSREGLFVIDTGSAKTLISYEMAGQAGRLSRDDRTKMNGINGQVADIYQTGEVLLQFAGFRQKNLGITSFNMWDQSRRIGTEISGFLGLPVLNLFTLTINYRDGLLTFERPIH